MLERIRRGKDDEGFTLIELLIVIIILGILAAIVVFAVGSTRGDSITATCKTDVKSIQLAEEAYYTKSGSYADGSTSSPIFSANGGVLKSMPSNPNIVFALTGSAGTYSLTATGKVAGTPAITQTSADSDVNTFCTAT